ncbi:hypothetical protein H8B02_44390 [Bradyrhizobium sp. Pear77]|uniref:hypothetical protein n=1 Tax=Bradyrhizobium altum TaxID=1571202 RepID=UPI001E4EF671|nr:hypothetical protein [Bradyrhizobium altum]MCC8960199.1 hypothetical protein [Bradyrhizobium altum]
MIPHPIAENLRTAFIEGRVDDLHLADASDLGGFVPEKAQCHDNARRWTALHPGSMIIEGWVASGDSIFEKHSVVTNENGELLCITPREPSAHSGSFIRHQPEWSPLPFADLPAQVMHPSIVEAAARAMLGPSFE